MKKFIVLFFLCVSILNAQENEKIVDNIKINMFHMVMDDAKYFPECFKLHYEHRYAYKMGYLDACKMSLSYLQKKEFD